MDVSGEYVSIMLNEDLPYGKKTTTSNETICNDVLEFIKEL
jgi:hypothetical protein